jgi:protein-S-isoprenylcysteine O-methyltransferase Ste14
MTAQYATYWLWAAWYATWMAAALWASRPVSRPRPGAGALHRIFATVGVVLLFIPARPGNWGLTARLWTDFPSADWALFALIVCSFAFCWWARIHLGKLWSGFVTTKAEHRIIDTGPYRYVRHPIYTGVIAAAFFTACIKSGVTGFLGFALIALGFWMTARIEERFLRQELGAGAYDAYSLRTPMIVPLLR